MFPSDWTPQKIIDESNISFENKIQNPKNPKEYIGTLPNGMEIGFEMKNGKISTFYPKYMGE